MRALFCGLLIALGLTAATASAQSSSPAVFACVPFDRLNCGCQVRLVGLKCAQPSSPRQPHLFTDLADQAPLLLFLNGKEYSVPLLRHTGSAKGERPARWTDVYKNGDLEISLKYTPGASTCPASKRDEGCEYLDVNVEVQMLLPGSGPQRFRGVGACGC